MTVDGELMQAMGRVEGKIDAYAASITRHDNEIDHLETRHENDVAELRDTINRHGNELTAVRTTLRLVWAGIGLALAVAGVLTPILVSVVH